MAPRPERAAAHTRAPARPALPPFVVTTEADDATLKLASAIDKLATSINRATTTLEPAAEVLGGMGHRLDALCAWFSKWGPRLLWSAPGVMVAIGAIQPNAAATLKAIITAITAAAGGG